MKKKIAAFIAAAMIFTAALPQTALAAKKSQGEQLYDKLMMIAELIKEQGLYSSENDDPMRTMLIKLFDQNPDAFGDVANWLLQAQDSHSGYFEQQEYDSAFPTQYSYVGIGVEVEATKDGIKISAVTENSAAEAVGIKAGDIITQIDGKDAENLSLSEVASVIRGEEGTQVKITVRRGDQTLSFDVTRARIGISNFSYELIEPGIGYMKLAKFDSLGTYIQFCRGFTRMLKDSAGSLILDLRGNPGGSLTIALNILQDLIPEKGIDFISFKTRSAKNGIVTETSTGRGIPLNKIVILIDGKSASASEITAGVLRDLGYAELVGTRSYGKATGQQHMQLTDGSNLVLTVLGIILPSGENYKDVGLKPDYTVENTISKYRMPPMERLDLNSELFPGNYSVKTKALNQRLRELGFINKSADYELMSFDGKTSEAVAVFQTVNGLKHTGYADKNTLAAIDREIKELAQSDVLNDKQLEKALEIARTVVGKELPYTFDESGDPVAKK